MKIKLKRLEDQVVVITGAPGGFGLATAKRAGQRGARVVLCSRNEPELRETAAQIEGAGGTARAVVADVSRLEDVERVAQTAVEEFGTLDTWVNNAGVSFYGRLTEVALEDMRQLFEVNFWGTVHGARAAIPQLRRDGGALINIGSIVSDRAIPLQGTYSASKQAVKGFTDALRMELEEEGAPVSVTLIKPSSIDTPYRAHAKNYMPVEPLNPPPVYAPETVAEAILHCAEHPERDMFVGGGGKALSVAGENAPGLTDAAMGATMFDLQRSDQPSPPDRDDSLHAPSRDGEERGGYPGHVAESSLYTKAAMHPIVTGAIVFAGAALG